ncbi:hypothetical protein [Lysinibacillus sp. NPDC092081]|uniref:hypothetical protein n=1 Tax=Lysinibacillus sp. NPDC092081 TaxID=3364131 RepID=UPI003826ADCE
MKKLLSIMLGTLLIIVGYGTNISNNKMYKGNSLTVGIIGPFVKKKLSLKK